MNLPKVLLKQVVKFYGYKFSKLRLVCHHLQSANSISLDWLLDNDFEFTTECYFSLMKRWKEKRIESRSLYDRMMEIMEWLRNNGVEEPETAKYKEWIKKRKF